MAGLLDSGTGETKRTHKKQKKRGRPPNAAKTETSSVEGEKRKSATARRDKHQNAKTKDKSTKANGHPQKRQKLASFARRTSPRGLTYLLPQPAAAANVLAVSSKSSASPPTPTGISGILEYMANGDAKFRVAQILQKERGLDINCLHEETSLLHHAARFGRTACIRFLHEKGINLNLRNSAGSTALFDAVEAGKLDAVRLLLKLKANPAITNAQGCSILHAACNAAQVETLGFLLKQKKLKIDQVDGFGFSPIFWCTNLLDKDNPMSITDDKELPRVPPSDLAVVGARVLDCVDVMIKAKANVDARDLSGNSVLFWAAGNCTFPGLTACLLRHGCDFELKNSVGDSPVFLDQTGLIAREFLWRAVERKDEKSFKYAMKHYFLNLKVATRRDRPGRQLGVNVAEIEEAKPLPEKLPSYHLTDSGYDSQLTADARKCASIRRSSRSRAVKAMSHYIATHASSLHSQPSSSIPVATSLKHPYIRRAQTLIASPVPIPLPSFYTISTLSSKKPNAQQPNCNSRRGYHSDIENDSSECEEEEEEDDDVDCIDSLGASIENDAASDGEDSTEEVMDEHTSGNFLVEFNETSLHLQGVSNRSNPSTAPRSVLPRRASPLHLLASYKDTVLGLGMLRDLLSLIEKHGDHCGLDTGAWDRKGLSCVHWAVRFGNHAAVRALLTQGVAPSSQTSRCNSSLKDRANAQDGREGWTPLMWTVCIADEDERKLTIGELLKHGANVNGRDFSGNNVLFWGMLHGRLELVRLVVDSVRSNHSAFVAMLSNTNYLGNSVFHYAYSMSKYTGDADRGRREVATWILKLLKADDLKPAASKMILQQKNLHGFTPQVCGSSVPLDFTLPPSPHADTFSSTTAATAAKKCKIQATRAPTAVRIEIEKPAASGIQNLGHAFPKDCEFISMDLPGKDVAMEEPLTFDLSNGRDLLPLRWSNPLNRRQPLFRFTSQPVAGAGVELPSLSVSHRHCSCGKESKAKASEVQAGVSGSNVLRCADKCECSKRPTSFPSDASNLSFDPRFTDKLYRPVPVRFGCNPLCGCHASCCSKFHLTGPRFALQVHRIAIETRSVFKTAEWRVRTRVPIPKHSFVLECVGEIIDGPEAARRERIYSKVGPLRAPSKADVSASVHQHEHFSPGAFFSFSCTNYSIDTTEFGNAARFLSHSCNSNLYPVLFFGDHHDVRFPRLLFFAARDIQPMEDLNFEHSPTTCLEASLTSSNTSAAVKTHLPRRYRPANRLVRHHLVVESAFSSS